MNDKKMIYNNIISELSMIIFENDDLSEKELYNLCKHHLYQSKYMSLSPCTHYFLIDQAFQIYYKM